MTKQILDVQQMQHLQELGLDLKDTMLSWCNIENEYKLIFSDMYETLKEYKILAYTLQDVLYSLPESIDEYCLIIDMTFGVIRYDNLTKRNNPILKETYFNDEDKYLIDASYELLVWAIKNKFVETNKNE